MKLRVLLVFAPLALLLSPPARSQTAATAATAVLSPLAASFDELLRRSSNGHSPTPEEIAAVNASILEVEPAALREALPLIEKALDNADTPVRTYALTTLVSLQSPPSPPAEPSPSEPPPPTPADPTSPTAAKTVSPPSTVPATYKPGLQKVLAPAIPKIAAHLTEESQPDRLLTATVLGGFTPDPPHSVYPPLLSFLKRNDALGAIGLAVVTDLLQLGPLTEEIATAIASFLRRSDQTASSRANLADAVSSSANQSPLLNKTLLSLLDSDDPSLRARIILSLPQLDLAPDVFADTRSRVAILAQNDQENLQVVNAAKAVAACWIATRMTSGCPLYQ